MAERYSLEAKVRRYLKQQHDIEPTSADIAAVMAGVVTKAKLDDLAETIKRRQE